MIDADKLNAAIKALKLLETEQKRYIVLRDKAGSIDRKNQTQKACQKAQTDMHFQALCVRRCHKAAWKAIVEADMETSLDTEIGCPSGFQEYRI